MPSQSPLVTMELFVDFQGFKNTSNEFIVKEFAIAATDGTVLQHWMVKSPCPYAVLDVRMKKQCTWTTNHYHGIRWQDGDTTIQALHRQLYPILNLSVVYVKGLEKANYIKEFFTPSLVLDLENYPSLKRLATSNVHCFHHRDSKMMCALNNVLKLVQYHSHEEEVPGVPPLPPASGGHSVQSYRSDKTHSNDGPVLNYCDGFKNTPQQQLHSSIYQNQRPRPDGPLQDCALGKDSHPLRRDDPCHTGRGVHWRSTLRLPTTEVRCGLHRQRHGELQPRSR